MSNLKNRNCKLFMLLSIMYIVFMTRLFNYTKKLFILLRKFKFLISSFFSRFDDPTGHEREITRTTLLYNISTWQEMVAPRKIPNQWQS